MSGEKSGEISSNKDLKAIASLIYTLLGGIKVVAKIEPNHKKLPSQARPALREGLQEAGVVSPGQVHILTPRSKTGRNFKEPI